MTRSFEKIITGGETFYSWYDIERAYPGKSGHALEMASKRAFAKQLNERVFFECLGLSFEVHFLPEYVAEYKSRPQHPASPPRPPRPPRPREAAKVVERVVEKTDARLLARVDALEAERKEYQKARIVDAAKFKKLENQLFALQKQLQELMSK
jgi:hypothetical protein